MTSFTDIYQKAEHTLEYWREACAVRDEQIAVLNARVAKLEGDVARLNWLDKHPSRIFNIALQWYSRAGYGMPLRRAKSLRDAIDAISKEAS